LKFSLQRPTPVSTIPYVPLDALVLVLKVMDANVPCGVGGTVPPLRANAYFKVPAELSICLTPSSGSAPSSVPGVKLTISNAEGLTERLISPPLTPRPLGSTVTAASN